MASSNRQERTPEKGLPATGLSPDPPTDLDGNPMPALVSGTSTEFLGGKIWPRTIQDRAVVFLVGPAGVGKTSVARAMAGDGAMYFSESEVLDVLKSYARRRRWPDDIISCSALVIEGPCFLQRRPAVVRALQDLLRERVGNRVRTWVCEGEDGGHIQLLMEAVHPRVRATIMLRFPQGRGRRRFASKICGDLGLDPLHAKAAAGLDPWTYDGVVASLKKINIRS